VEEPTTEAAHSPYVQKPLWASTAKAQCLNAFTVQSPSRECAVRAEEIAAREAAVSHLTVFGCPTSFAQFGRSQLPPRARIPVPAFALAEGVD